MVVLALEKSQVMFRLKALLYFRLTVLGHLAYVRIS